jgi:arylsulfatase A-like enzyme
MKQPNILIIWTDEQRADSMAAYGNQRVATPHLDRLARESVLAEQCYVSQPICTPSRSTVLTGLWPHQNGCTSNNIRLGPETPCLPEMLPEHYECAYMGKWHLGDEISAQHGFSEWVSIEDMYRGYQRDPADRETPCTYTEWLEQQGFVPNYPDERLADRWFASCLPYRYSKPAFLAEQAGEFLRRERHQPFCLHVNFLEPHSPINGPYNGRHDPVQEPPPANFGPDAYAVPERYQDMIEQRSWPEQATINARYWGLVEEVDEAVGAILQALEQSSALEDTIICFTSDHGNCLGSHGIMFKTVMYQESVRVPLLLRLPAGDHAGQRVAGPVSHIDLLPTLLDYAGVPVPDSLPGCSLRGVIDASEAERDAFIQWHPVVRQANVDHHPKDPERDVPERCIITADGWKYVSRPEGVPELLIDLKADPLEQHDRSQEPEQAQRLAELRQRIHTWQESVGDTVRIR